MIPASGHKFRRSPAPGRMVKRPNRRGWVCTAAGVLVAASAMADSTVPASVQPEGFCFPLFLTVGSDAACTDTNLQDAIEEARVAGPCQDLIRIAKNHTDTSLGINILGHPVVIEGGFDDCADSTPSGVTVLDGSGGVADSVIELISGSGGPHEVVLRNLRITGGEDDTDFGGGIGITGPATYTLILDGVEVTGNASRRGAGIHVTGSGNQVILRGGTSINNNEASDRGGGLACEGGASVSFEEGEITRNRADGPGGGTYLDACEFVSGGATISFNDAGEGGGIYAIGQSSIILAGNGDRPALVLENSAVQVPSGIYVINSQMEAHNAWVLGNNVELVVGSDLRLDRSLGGDCHDPVRCSQLSTDSEDFLLRASDSNVRIFQTYLTGSTESELIGVRDSELLVEGVVIADSNVASGPLFLVNGSGSVTVAQSTLVGNAVGTNASIFTNPASYDLGILSSILWDNGSPVYEGSGGVFVDCLITQDNTLPAGRMITVQDPLFVDPGSGDYHLSAASPAIDYCDDLFYSALADDIDGGGRGIDAPRAPNQLGIFDIGADEFEDMEVIFTDSFEAGIMSG